MSHQDTRKKVLAKRLGVSERVLEQYLELKHAEANEDASPDLKLSQRDDISGASLSSSEFATPAEDRRRHKDPKRHLGRAERRVSEGSS